MVVNSKFLHRCIDTQMFFFHGFYNHSLEFRRISFVWYSFWHSKTPHLLNSISYCLTNGVLFIISASGFYRVSNYTILKFLRFLFFQRRNNNPRNKTQPRLMPMERATLSISQSSGTPRVLPAMSTSGLAVTWLFTMATVTPKWSSATRRAA